MQRSIADERSQELGAVRASMTLRKQVLSGLKWTAGAKLGGQVITWGITLWVMRLLSPGDYGLLAMAMVFVAFLLMMAEAGLGSALVQKEDLDEAQLRQAFGIIIVVNLGLLAVLNLLAPAIATFFEDDRLLPVLRVLSLYFLIIAMGVIPDVLLQRKLEFKKRSLIDLTAAVFSSVLTLALALAHYGVWALVLGSLFGAAWRVGAANLVAPFRLLPNFSLQGMRGLLSFGGKVTMSRLLWFFFTQADVIIVGKLLGKEMLGFYSVAMHLASLPVQRVSAIVNQVAFPVFSRLQEDRENLSGYVIKAIRILSFLAFPVLWGISSTAHEIVLLFLGQKWKDAILPLQLLSMMMPLRMVANFLPTASDALGRPDLGLKNVLVASLIMPAAFLIASQWGIVGVAVAWVTVYPVVLLFNVRRMLHVMGSGLRELLHAIAPAIISAAGMYAAVWTARWLLGDDISQLTKLLVMIATGMLMYGGLALLLNRQGCREVYGLIGRK